MKIRNTLKHIFSLPFAVGFLLASLISLAMNTYYAKKESERNKLFQERQDRHRQEDQEWKKENREREDRYSQEVMKQLKRIRDNSGK